jgi:hypothetical protein
MVLAMAVVTAGPALAAPGNGQGVGQGIGDGNTTHPDNGNHTANSGGALNNSGSFYEH